MLVLFEEQKFGMAGVERTKWRIKKVMQNHSYRVGRSWYGPYMFL